MTLTITYPQLLLMGVAALLFLVGLFICWQQGLFDGHDTYGIGCVFSVAIMAVVFAIPSLAAWAIYATWWK